MIKQWGHNIHGRQERGEEDTAALFEALYDLKAYMLPLNAEPTKTSVNYSVAGALLTAM